MRIEHAALWVEDLEKMKTFYCTYFQGSASEKYTNSQKQFSSYFLSFESGTRLEIMHRPGLEKSSQSITYGLVHLAFSTGSRESVDRLTERLREEGYTISGNPRTTGDGYYESVVLDPEGNQLEITE
jgi:lactoylglutathione lyase